MILKNQKMQEKSIIIKEVHKMLKNKTLTYISLFSCAGVGCFGFKKAGFECIATNELIERRLNVQKFNNKCKYESGLSLIHI